MEVTTAKKIDAKRLPTSTDTVEKLQNSLQAKAKNEPNYRFYTLWDKLYRTDVLEKAYGRCRANRGSPGADGITFDQIDSEGLERWIGNLQEELKGGYYRPTPLLRVWIPKKNGKMRPLSIPTIKDRVVQMAMLLVIGPIFDVDLDCFQYGFRPKLDAKMALRRVYYQVTQNKRPEVIDADLSDYFNTIPHSPLMRSISRRVADGRVLKTIKAWLRVPVIEKVGRVQKQTNEAKAKKRGAAQGGPISPLLSNIYFRRLMKAWDEKGLYRFNSLNAKIVNYADDFVVCCGVGKGNAAMQAIRTVVDKLGLTLNEEKTKLVNILETPIDFLGYTIGMQHGKDGRRAFVTRPSRDALKRVRLKIHEETSCRWNATTPQERVRQLNQILKGWYNYFDQGDVGPSYRNIIRYTERRFRRWLMRKHQWRGTGYRQFPDKYLYEELGLYKPPMSRADRSRAKACQTR